MPKLYIDELKQAESCLMNATTKDDFNVGHGDPNLTHAKKLVA